MSDEPERDRWLAIAGKIAEGEQIAWDVETRELEEDPALIGALRALETIADAQRRIQEAPSVELTRWGHLTILEKTAAGSYWARYRAHDPGLPGEVTLLLVGPVGGEPATVERLLRRARAQTQVHHPNVATVYGADYAQDYVGLWSESNAESTLEQIVQSHGPLEASEAASLVADLRGAVDAFHQAGLVHGAVWPGNITRSRDGRVVLGASMPVPVPTRPSERPRPDRDFYLAPEILGGGAAGKASDVFGLGLTLHYLVTGRYPVRSTANRKEAARAMKGMSRALAPIVERALAVDPAGRFETATDLEDAVRRADRAGRLGRDWIIGFVIAALLAGLMMWLAFNA